MLSIRMRAIRRLWSDVSKADVEKFIKATAKSGSRGSLIDVRRRAEIAAHGAIPTAINVPLDELERHLDGIDERERDKEMIFYCLAGVRSQKAVDLARAKGFNNCHNYKGSYEDWFKKTYDSAKFR